LALQGSIFWKVPTQLSVDVIWGEKYENGREKGGKCKIKRKKEERKGRTGKE
jgi:hypothetical protein